MPVEVYAVPAIPRTAAGAVVRHRLLDEPARLLASAATVHDELFELGWEPVPGGTADGEPGDWVLVGPGELAGATESFVDTYAGLPALLAAVADGRPAPDVACVELGTDGALPEQLAACLADERLAVTRLVLLTRGAVHAGGYAPEPGAGRRVGPRPGAPAAHAVPHRARRRGRGDRAGAARRRGVRPRRGGRPVGDPAAPHVPARRAPHRRGPRSAAPSCWSASPTRTWPGT